MLEEYSQALAVLRDFVSRAPERPWGHALLAVTRAQLGQLEEALLLVSAAGGIAHAAGLERLAGSQRGEPRDIWFRFTLCFARTSVGWRITHEHTSLPVRKLRGELIAPTDLSP